MPKFKDYYGILGVTTQATQDEIKKSYRDLAKKYHPDKNSDDKVAEEKFKEVSEAYDTLSNPVKKRKYDYGKAGRNANPIESVFSGLGVSFFRRRRPQTDQKIAIRISMKDAYYGTSVSLNINKSTHCSSCQGKGLVAPVEDQGPCDVCSGTGTRSGIIPCTSCGGSGKAGVAPCHRCSGNGFKEAMEKISIKIPSRLRSGSTMKVAGMGNVDSRGRRGNLYIQVQYPQSEEGFTVRADGSMYCTVKIPWEKVLRDEGIDIPIFSGNESVKVKLDGTKIEGETAVFPKKGMASKALVIKVLFSLKENMSKTDRSRIANILEKYAVSEGGSSKSSV